MTRALATTGADLGAALASFAGHVERRGAAYVAYDDAEAEFTALGHGATPEEAITDLRNQDGIEGEQREIDTDAGDWIAPGGWDDEDEGWATPDEGDAE